MAASVANFKHFILEIVGSNTPCCLLSLTDPKRMYILKHDCCLFVCLFVCLPLLSCGMEAY